MTDDSFLQEIQDDFLREASEILQKTEMLFLQLEKPGNHSEVFNQLKRIAHNFKGSGKAVGFDSLSSFSHHIENLLIALHNNEIEISPEAIQLLLDCSDTLKNCINELQKNKKFELNNDHFIEQIDALLNNKNQSNHKPQLSNATVPETSQKPNNALNQSPFDQTELKHNQANPEERKKTELQKNEQKPSELKQTTGLTQSIDESIRIPLKKIDAILDTFGEQIIHLSTLDHLQEDVEKNKDELVRTIFNLKKLAFEIQQSTMSLRMVNLKSLFTKLERAIRDASKATKKNVLYQLEGSDQELDKIIVDQLSDPLTHMVRNAVDHGIEDIEERLNNGKPENGNIQIKAKREGSSFIIEIIDDGKGLDSLKIRKKAIEKGLILESDNRPEKEIFELIFENGFSTKENVSEISGRGVGMNVVKEMIEAMKGTYEIESKIGLGTTFRLKLPLTLSLFNALLIHSGQSRYLIPSPQVSEIIKSDDIEIRELGNYKLIAKVRDQIIEILDLDQIISFTKKQIDLKHKMLLIVDLNSKKLGFLVDKVVSIQKIVQKPLSPEMTACPGAIGLTVLGDGSPSLIIDLKAISTEHLHSLNPSHSQVLI